MPKVRMLKSDKGSEDGIAIISFEEFKEYEVSEFLANEFINRRKTALLVEEKAPLDMGFGDEGYSATKKPIEEKAEEKVLENKAIVPVENKAKKKKNK